MPRIRHDYDAERFGARCGECPLRGVHRPVPPKGPWRSPVAIVGEGPGREEIARGSPFVGQSGLLLRDLLAEAWRHVPHGVAKLRYDDLWITNSTLCKPPAGDMVGYLASLRVANAEAKRAWRKDVAAVKAKWVDRVGFARLTGGKIPAKPMVPDPPVPVAMPTDCCWPRLRWELLQPWRIVIIPVGALALQALAPKKKGIVRWRGAPFEWTPEGMLQVG